MLIGLAREPNERWARKSHWTHMKQESIVSRQYKMDTT